MQTISVAANMRDANITFDSDQYAVVFDTNYRVFEIQNKTDDDIIASIYPDKTTSDDGIRLIKKNETGTLNHLQDNINTVYITGTGTGRVYIAAGNSQKSSFNGTGGGGDSSSALVGTVDYGTGVENKPRINNVVLTSGTKSSELGIVVDDIADFPEALPADGGNAGTVNNHTVNADVPAGAKFTDTVYTLPTASTTEKGGVKVDGSTIVIDENGVISSTGGGDVSENYSVLINKPQINGVTLQDNKTLEDLGIEIPETTTVITAASTGDEVPTAKAVYDLTEGKEDTANKTTSISDTPDDTKYPTEKAVADYVKENAGEGAEYMGVDPILVGFDLRGYGACVVKNYSYGTYKYYGAYAKRHYNGIIVSIYPPMLTVYPNGTESASTSSSSMSIDNNTELYGDVRDEDGNPVPEFITKNNNISLKYDDETVKVNDDGKLYAVQKEYTGDGDTVTISEDGVISAQKGIDSIKIGGRNYYKGTKDFSGNAWKMRNYWEIAEEKFNDFDVMRNNHAWHGLSQTVHVNAGESYIYSAYVKADTDDYPCAIFNKMGDTIDDTIASDDYANFDVDYRNVSVGTSWIKVSVVFTATTSGYAAFRIEKKVETDNIYLYVAGIKVEKGNKPTDWTPAPEDLEYTADDLMEAIAELAEKQEADKIETQEAIAELAESLM